MKAKAEKEQAGNFSFLLAREDWRPLYERAEGAERALAILPEMAAVAARSAMELGVKWVCTQEGISTRDPMHPSRDRELYALLHDRAFVRVLDQPELWEMLDQLRRLGNRAAHGASIERRDALLMLRILFNFCAWLAYCYTTAEVPQAFDASLLPEGGARDEQEEKSREEIARYAAKLAAQDTALAQKAQEVDALKEEKEQLAKELRRLRQERQKAQAFAVDKATEAETRRRFIDYDLRDAGWILGQNCRAEELVEEMPNAAGVGFSDYVLYGGDMRPLAIVEAKRTSYDAAKGLKQAELYADSMEKKYGRRPFIFLTNGFEIYFLDDDQRTNYPRRRVSGFFSPEELADRMEQRETRQPITDCRVNAAITSRAYQMQAVRAVQEAAEAHRRKFLIVQATGTGKTRVAVGVADLFLRAHWAKRILFLADRTALVRQGKTSGFQPFFEGRLPMVNLLEHPEQAGTARLVFSTYPTMLHAIDAARQASGRRIFTPAHFDLIIIDESHRSIYQRYQAIFDYFDAMLLGLTATPKSEVDRNTYAFFDLEDGVPTFSYDYETAVRDGFIVPFRLENRTTKFLREGVKYAELSGAQKEQYEETFGCGGEDAPDIDSTALNRYFFNRSTVEQVLKTLMQDGIRIEGGDRLGKTIIFAKNRRHAEFIVDVFHSLYPEYGEDYIARIDGSVDYHDALIESFSVRGHLPQIAVSVDMLDTGVDVPDVLNLVFFKKVRSISKFWQMIGRGTRLSPDIFGPGEDKKEFLILDFGGNFEFFSVHGKEGRGEKLAKPLSEQLYDAELSVYALLLGRESPTEEERALCAELRESLFRAVQALPTDDFRVREQRRAYEKYRRAEAWDRLTPQDAEEIEQTLAPLMPAVLGIEEDERVRRFDLRLYRMMLGVLEGEDVSRSAEAVRQVADALSRERMQAIPQVRARAGFIQQARRADFWQSLTLAKLRQTREELRTLVQLLAKDAKNPVYGTIYDPLVPAPEVQIGEGAPIYTSPAAYKAKVSEYLNDHQNNLAVYKLRHNEPLTRTDLRELERVFWQELGSEQTYKDAYGETPLGKLVRSVVGMDRAALQQAFAEFLQANRLNAQQMDFVGRIIDYLAQNGTLERQDLVNDKKTRDVFDSFGDVVSIFAGKEREFAAIMDRAEQVSRNCYEIA